MKLQEYTWVTNTLLAKVASYIERVSGRKNVFTTDIEDCFEEAYAKKQVYVVGRDEASISYFKSPYQTEEGENLWFLMQINDNTISDTAWRCLYVQTESELLNKLITCSYTHISNLYFDSRASLNAFLSDLANKALPEPWDYKHYKSVLEHPILKTYVETTYMKLCSEYRTLQEENADLENGRLPLAFYNNCIYFNSGLLDRFYNQLIIMGDEDKVKIDFPGLPTGTKTVYRNLRCFAHNSYEISKDFDEYNLPVMATYFRDLKDTVFNADLQVNLNDKHIIIDGLERDRIPKFIDQYESCKNDDLRKSYFVNNVTKEINAAVERTLKLAKRNYKMIVPMYNRDADEIQYLLPIFLSNSDDGPVEPQCALALRYDDSGRIPNYRAMTVLTLDMAYQNARIISNLDSHWLEQGLKK